MNNLSSYNILVVEDENDIAIAIEAYLNNQGYNVFIANNGIEGLELLKKETMQGRRCAGGIRPQGGCHQGKAGRLSGKCT